MSPYSKWNVIINFETMSSQSHLTSHPLGKHYWKFIAPLHLSLVTYNISQKNILVKFA